MLLNNRVVERDRCAIEAKIVIANIEAPISCLITDISEDGARLKLANNEDLPSRFDLLLPICADIVDRRAVELRWQHGRMLGVCFEQN